jgi:hypothetical protein
VALQKHDFSSSVQSARDLCATPVRFYNFVTRSVQERIVTAQMHTGAADDCQQAFVLVVLFHAA